MEDGIALIFSIQMLFLNAPFLNLFGCFSKLGGGSGLFVLLIVESFEFGGCVLLLRGRFLEDDQVIGSSFSMAKRGEAIRNTNPQRKKTFK